ncbi:unnamed protein product [Malus baccata var. baccata]|uniref:Uncharacterized protein n=1 Tax=Malus domestica TaxID=3750 RepID=A0A498HV76_MALDO|nr:hypothetical protein DVH24_016237 [Malus domestica]
MGKLGLSQELPTFSSNSSQHMGFTWTLKLCHIFKNGRPNRQMNLQKMMTSLMLLFLIESAVKDILAAADKYEEEEEESLEKVVEFFQSKCFKKDFIYHIPFSCHFCRCRDEFKVKRGKHRSSLCISI